MNPPNVIPQSPFPDGSFTPAERPTRRLFYMAVFFLNSLAVLTLLHLLTFVWIMLFNPRGFIDEPIGYFIVGGLLVLDFLAALLHFFPACRLAARHRAARGWAIAAAVVACCQFWCSLGWLLGLGTGIYLIIILMRPDVRNALGIEKPQGFDVQFPSTPTTPPMESPP